MKNKDANRKMISLITKDQLNIYMNPTRQQLLRELTIAGCPLTAKALSDRLSISASSVQHHIRKLLSIGLVEMDHTGIINGITATYYKAVPATVQIGVSQGYPNEKRALVMQLVNNVLSGYMRMAERFTEAQITSESAKKYGDVMTGVAFITDQERDELNERIGGYLLEHEHAEPGAKAWEYALIMYDAAGETKK